MRSLFSTLPVLATPAAASVGGNFFFTLAPIGANQFRRGGFSLSFNLTCYIERPDPIALTQEFGTLLKTEVERWKAVSKAAGIKAE